MKLVLCSFCWLFCVFYGYIAPLCNCYRQLDPLLYSVGNIYSYKEVTSYLAYRYAREVYRTLQKVSRFMCVPTHSKTSETSKNIFTKMLKEVGIEVPKSIETRSKCSMHADKGRDDCMQQSKHA